jgi:hypothetical protein
MTKEEKELAEIENMATSWRSEIMRIQWIFEQIAEKINSTKDTEHDFWCRVMDLYLKKYK